MVMVMVMVMSQERRVVLWMYPHLILLGNTPCHYVLSTYPVTVSCRVIVFFPINTPSRYPLYPKPKPNPKPHL